MAVELLYQSISYHWAEDLRAYDAPETRRSLDDCDNVPNEPLVVAMAAASVDQ